MSAGLSRLDVHRLGIFARSPLGVDVARMEGETRDRTGVRLAAIHGDEARHLERLLQLMEVPEPVIALADAAKIAVLRAQRCRQPCEPEPQPGSP